ncbi:MAG: DNA alkylation repair protein [Euryarchaeota archaeon]|mgnify:CR=1 FL=1|nr:DNA alkylation repair protein [Euryarchaeota archaeon]|tara:strand:- start:3047 stop:3733 length:687 start_codon:yes stop_codon:yes gene_type:complete
MKDRIIKHITNTLNDNKNSKDAIQMQRYMKTTMPFYGVKSPILNIIVNDVKNLHLISNQEEYNSIIMDIWNLSHREEKYISIKLARKWKQYITLEALIVYEKMIREGQWWDFIDPISQGLIGILLMNNRFEMNIILDKWIEDENFWIRRSAILAHLKHKENTDYKKLFEYCLKCAHEKEFFIQKAIGWVLREYSKTKPEIVYAFIQDNEQILSNLSKREGMKYIKKNS